MPYVSAPSNYVAVTISLPFCLSVGPVTVSLSITEKKFTEVKPGGRGFPSNCIARHRVAIIIPFRDRPNHLQTLLYNLHPILLRQQVDYQIFVIEQEGEYMSAMNRYQNTLCRFHKRRQNFQSAVLNFSYFTE